MPLALEGLRVIDCSQGVSGPFCAMQLGDLGADVIKLEPVTGDWLRGIGPYQGGESAVFLQVNRNKRGIAVDLKSSGGCTVMERLIDGADILIEGYRPGKMDTLGFGYNTVSRRNPRIVYGSVSGYGQSGPWRDAPGTELDVQAIVGANRHLGVPGAAPVRFGFDLASTAAGMAAFQAVMVALLWRERTGEGQHVDTSLLAAFTAVNQWTFSAEHSHDTWEGRPLLGLTDPPEHGFRTADGPALINMRGNEAAWNELLIAIDRPEVLLDPRFSTPQAIMDNVVALPEVINGTLQEWPFEDLRHLVQDRLGGTIVRMNDFDQLVHDPQVAALGMIQTISGHPTAGDVRTINVPWGFQEELAALRRPSPILGQHTHEVLRETGYADADIESLVATKAVYAR